MPTPTKTESCSQCPAYPKSAFSACSSEDDLTAIDALREDCSFAQGDFLPLERNGNIGFYCIGSGNARLGYATDRHSGIVRICGPGDLVAYCREPDDAKVIVALEAGRSCFIPTAPFNKLRRQSTSVADGVVGKLCKAITVRDRRIVALESYHLKSRVASSLLALAEEFGQESEHGVKINIKLDRRVLAKLAATRQESLARQLTEFEKDGLIVRAGREIHVRDSDGLRTLTRD